MQIFEIILLLPLPVLMLYAAGSDIYGYIIPNWISLALIGIFFPVFFLSGLPIEQITDHLWPALVVFIVCFGLFALGYIGGGDAKLLPAATLWIGAADVVHFIAAVSLAGGALCVFMLIFWLFKRYIPQILSISRTACMERPKVAPYGVAIAVGTLVIFPLTPLFAALS